MSFSLSSCSSKIIARLWETKQKQIQLIVEWTSINQLGLTNLIVEVLFSSVPNLKIPSW